MRHSVENKRNITLARNLPFLERNIRRARLYSGRIIRSSVLPAPRHPCLFMHMPKCGGTSISEAMYATVPLGRGVAVIDAVSTRRAAAIYEFGRDEPLLCHEDQPHGDKVFDLRERLMLQQMAWGAWLIHGHVLFSDRADAQFGQKFRYVTLLRDPVDRMISNYRMAVNAGVVPEGLDTYLDTPVARSHAQVYLRYLSGQTVVPDADVPAKLALAQSRLARFAVVGFLDDLPAFQQRYLSVFGVPLRIKTYNQGKGTKPSLTASQMDKITALTAPDQAIFDLAHKTRHDGPPA
jgi:Sulfotransferase family